MKKGWTLISMLLWLACVCRTGSAAERVSIRELHESIEQEPRWTASYEAYKREIEVDIPIDIPEVNAVPIVQVSGYYAVDQEGCLTRDGTKLNKIGNDGFDIYEEDGLMTYLSTTCANGEIKAAPFEQDKTVLFLAYYNSPSNLRTHKVKYDTEVYYPYEVDADKIYAEDNPQSATEAKAYLERVLGYFYPKSENSVALRHLEVRSRGHKVKYDSKVYYPYEVDADEIYAEDNPQSAAAAKAYLERVLGYFYPESDNSIALRYLEVRSRGHKVKGLDDYKLGDYVKNYPMGTYALNFCQTIQGIPVYHDVGERLDTTGYNNAPEGLIDDAWEKSEPIMRISDNRFEFMGDDSFEMLVRWVKEAGIIKEDVPLAPLSSIISSIEDEIQKGHIRNVYALRLGYGCYITNESPETYVLYPTWICDCDYIGDPKEKINVSAYNIEKDFNKKYTFKTLVINAQTGEMDDPYLSKKEQIFCPTIITWEDAQ